MPTVGVGGTGARVERAHAGERRGPGPTVLGGTTLGLRPARHREMPASGACPLRKRWSSPRRLERCIFAVHASKRCFRCGRCGRLTEVCSRCDRGQRYCSGDCRQQQRRSDLRAAEQRYRQTPKGSRNNADRQRRHRERQRSNGRLPTSSRESVTHQSSDSSAVRPPSAAHEPTTTVSSSPHAALAARPGCAVCGCLVDFQRYDFLRPRERRGSRRGPPERRRT